MTHLIPFMTERKVNEHLLSSVSPQSHSSNASVLGEQLSSVGWVTLGKVTFTQILHFRFWRCCIKKYGVCPPSCHWHAPGDVLELCIHALFTWSIVERQLPCWVKKGVCLLNRWAPGLESVCMWHEGSVWLCYVHLWAPGILETHEFFSSISVVALIVFCKNEIHRLIQEGKSNTLGLTQNGFTSLQNRACSKILPLSGGIGVVFTLFFIFLAIIWIFYELVCHLYKKKITSKPVFNFRDRHWMP